MAKIDRPAIVAGNDTTLYIKLKEFKDGEYVDDFDLTQVSDLKVELLCSRDNYRYEIPYNIDPTYKNLIICDLKHTYYHTNTSYGINVTGTNKDGKHWTWCMMPREGFLVVSNTSGLHLTDEAQQLSFNGLVGWGISTGTDLTNYYTKITIDNLLNEKADKSALAKVATSGDYNDLSNKPVVKEQVQSDWNEKDKTKPDYIKNKPDLSQYIKEQELNNYYNKGEVDVMLNNKVDTSTLNSDYYNKNAVNNLLDSKVDTSELSQVAISGDYNELTNKPDLSQYATKEEVNAKQDTLISGENIKTINGQDILGSGDIVISGGDKTYEEQYLTFEALEDGTFSFTANDLQYSLDDGVTWQTLTAETSTPTISAGNKILWKQTGLTPVSNIGIGTFSSTGQFNVYGNIMSLLYGDDFIGQNDLSGLDWLFFKLFYGCSNLISAENLILQAQYLVLNCYKWMFMHCASLTKVPELPAQYLAPNCYDSMFYSCSSLTKAPELPAINLDEYCYIWMFHDCSSLTTGPEKLPAETLATGCYNGMFYNCRSLVKAPELPATMLEVECYKDMFANCSSLTKAPELPATDLAVRCYEYMFHGCESLTKAPELPSTYLVDYCYRWMFSSCYNLSYVKCLAEDISANECISGWFNDGISYEGIFIKSNYSPEYEINSTSGIPEGWTSYTDYEYSEVRHYELANVATTGDYNDLVNKPEISNSPIYYVNLKWQNYPKDSSWQGSQAVEFQYLEVWNLTSGEQVYHSNFLSKTPGTVINEIYDQFNIKCDFYKDNVSANLANLTFRNWNGYTWLDIPQGTDVNYIGNGSILQFYFYEYNKSTYKVTKYCNSIIIPILPSKGQMVTSSNNGLKIEVVNSLPETPVENTIYIIV